MSVAMNSFLCRFPPSNGHRVGATCSTWSKTHSRATYLPIADRSTFGLVPAGTELLQYLPSTPFKGCYYWYLTISSAARTVLSNNDDRTVSCEELDRALSSCLNPLLAISVRSNDDDRDTRLLKHGPALSPASRIRYQT